MALYVRFQTVPFVYMNIPYSLKNVILNRIKVRLFIYIACILALREIDRWGCFSTDFPHYYKDIIFIRLF